MSESLRQRVEKIEELLSQLAKEAAKGTPIIVEGARDAETLRRLSVEGDLIEAKGFGRSLLDVLGEAKGRNTGEVIVFMDFDRRGREWTQRLARGFERMGVKANLVFWRRLRGLVGGDLKDIEGLATYLETLRGKLEGHQIS